MSDKVYFYYPHEQGDADYFNQTSAAWILQTYLRVFSTDVRVKLVSHIPDSGIVVGFVGDLPPHMPPKRERFLIAVVADAAPYQFANLHVVQNVRQTQLISRSRFIQHWPQPGLIPRNAQRRTLVENVAYIGSKENVAPELLSDKFRAALECIGLRWEVRLTGSPNVCDYSEVDALVAVRSLGKSGFVRKPASKLQNCWLAKTPGVLGSEFAYREAGSPGHDYIEANSVEEIVAGLQRLKNDSAFYRSIVSAGLQKSASLESQIACRWRDVIEEAMAAPRSWRDGNEFFSNATYGVERKLRGLRSKWLRTRGLSHNDL